MWKEFIEAEEAKTYFKKLNTFLEEEYKYQTVYPKLSDIYNVFKLELEDIKVVILGQDPYHNPDQADGLAFSSDKIPPSLRNIYKELNDDIGIDIPLSGRLNDWAKQGVFLLNTCLTVRKNEPLSHDKIGWQTFTDEVIKHIAVNTKNTVFILWGANARKKKELIKGEHLILESVHPSPLSASRGFFKSKPFSQTNEYLMCAGKKPIDWQVKIIDLFNQL